MTIAAGIELPETEIADVCRRHQVRELSLFGSTVSGEMRPDSDVDLLVDFLPSARPGLSSVSAMMREFTTLLGRRVDLGCQACTEAMSRQNRNVPLPGKVEMFRNVPFPLGLCGVHVNLRLPVKRRRAMLASNPIEE
jgi:predicted nucleotidyltransferase